MKDKQKIYILTVIIAVLAIITVVCYVAYYNTITNLRSCQEAYTGLNTSNKSTVYTRKMVNFCYGMDDTIDIRSYRGLKMIRRELGTNPETSSIDITSSALQFLNVNVSFTSRQLIEMITGTPIQEDKNYILSGWYIG